MEERELTSAKECREGVIKVVSEGRCEGGGGQRGVTLKTCE